jgi:hypothetical protein
MLSTTPVLASPMPKEPMLLYIAATNRVVSAVVVVEREEGGKTVQRCRCSGYRGIPVHLLLGPVIGPSSAQGKDDDPSYGEDPHEEAPHEENDDQNC